MLPSILKKYKDTLKRITTPSLPEDKEKARVFSLYKEAEEIVNNPNSSPEDLHVAHTSLFSKPKDPSFHGMHSDLKTKLAAHPNLNPRIMNDLYGHSVLHSDDPILGKLHIVLDNNSSAWNKIMSASQIRDVPSAIHKTKRQDVHNFYLTQGNRQEKKDLIQYNKNLKPEIIRAVAHGNIALDDEDIKIAQMRHINDGNRLNYEEIGKNKAPLLPLHVVSGKLSKEDAALHNVLINRKDIQPAPPANLIKIKAGDKVLGYYNPAKKKSATP